MISGIIKYSDSPIDYEVLIFQRQFLSMANHKSSEKRIRQIRTKNESNKYHAKTMRNALKTIRSTSSKEEAGTMLPKINSMLDRLAKKNVIHKKKASNLKSSVQKHVSNLK